MSGEMPMNIPSVISRKRPLSDATLEMNTPKREYYPQQFHPYPYMNMMTPPPMFQTPPFSIRGDENHQPPPFMSGEFCPPVGSIFNEMQMHMNAPYTPF
ncbi:hypothetical protein GCK32_019561, partial [Trichostrongylus colubriformis]